MKKSLCLYAVNWFCMILANLNNLKDISGRWDGKLKYKGKPTLIQRKNIISAIPLAGYMQSRQVSEIPKWKSYSTSSVSETYQHKNNILA